MLKIFREKNTLYCFTPEVMLATLAIEIVLAAYTFLRYRMTAFGVVSSAILVFLAVFQIAEYQICTGETQVFWARIGMIAITLLPILGLHLIMLVNNTEKLLKLVYLVAFGSIVFFIFSPTAITNAMCGGNYVIFKSAHQLYQLYALYYFGLLFVGIWKIYEQIVSNSHDLRKRSVLYWILAGYLSFMLPTAIVYGFYESALQGTISIMCGFAIVFALILALRAAPLYHGTNNMK